MSLNKTKKRHPLTENESNCNISFVQMDTPKYPIFAAFWGKQTLREKILQFVFDMIYADTQLHIHTEADEKW